MESLIAYITNLQLDYIQIAALVFGVTEVFLARANSVWLYPSGIAAILLSVFSLFNAQLYADCILHIYYFVMSIYGWWYWVTKHDNKEVYITFSNAYEWRTTIGIVIFAWIALYLFLTTFTPSELPIWDSWVSATGWAGMWLLARRKVENWILLNISNAFAIPLLIYKDLWWLAILTIVLFLVACKGYFDWRKSAHEKLLTTKA